MTPPDPYTTFVRAWDAAARVIDHALVRALPVL